MFLCELQRLFTSFVIYISMKNDFRSITFGSVDFDQWCGSRHHDHCLGSITFCRIRHPLCMIPGRSSNNPFFTLLFTECTHFVISTSYLICTGKLHIFWLQIYLITGLVAQILTVNQFRRQSSLFDLFRSFFKFFQCQHFTAHIILLPAPVSVESHQTMRLQTGPHQTSVNLQYFLQRRYT